MHEFLGKRCHVGVFAVGVAFGKQFAEVGEGFAVVFRVNFVEEGGDAAVVQLQFAILAHTEADRVEVGFEAGLKEQAAVEVVGEVGVSFFYRINDVLRLLLRTIIEVRREGACKGVKDGNFLAKRSFLFLFWVFDTK